MFYRGEHSLIVFGLINPNYFLLLKFSFVWAKNCVGGLVLGEIEVRRA